MTTTVEGPPVGVITAWAVTSGEAGMRTQARGLAEASADSVVEKTVTLRAPWRWSPALAARPLSHLEPSGDRLDPPWPDLIITCGRRSAPLALAVRSESGGRTVAVHIQDPRLPLGAFDLIVALDHDRLAHAPNLIATATAMHDVTPERLVAAAEAWRDRLAPLGRPLVGVLIGGSTRRRAFGPRQSAKLVDGLERLRREAGAALAISPSRRTPPLVLEALAKAFGSDPRVFLWDRTGENPYLAILAASDRLVVTGDSVSMVSEAVATSHPVEVFDPDSDRHERFLEQLAGVGRVRRFEGDPSPPPTSGPINATLQVAARVRRILQQRRTDQARTGVVG